MKRDKEFYNHKYLFYFFPLYDHKGKKIKDGTFYYFMRVKDGKEKAESTGRQYDYKKIY